MEIKRVKLNYRPIAKRTSNEIAFVVSNNHINSLNKSIRNKLERNQLERSQSSILAKDYHVGSDYSKIDNNKTLVKKI